MCIVCVLLDKDKITKAEAKKALWEQIAVSDTQEEMDHIQKVYGELDYDDKS